jgi:DNA sulfur modification protein DndD
VTLDRIVLENVGLYSGRNELELTPDSPSKPIVLIGGMNGAGKTTLLDSFQIGLYGAQAAPAGRAGESYKAYLAGMIHHSADVSVGASIEIQFRRFNAGLEERIGVKRAWREAQNGIVESLDVTKNGEPDAFLSEHWSEFIENYLPARLANLFFFDGEQIKEFAEEAGAARLLSTAVHALLGLDLVDQLSSDLQVLERKKKISSLTADMKELVEAAGQKASEARQNGERVAQSLGEVQNRRDRLANDVATVRDKLRAQGGDLFDKQKDLEKEEAAVVGRQELLSHQLREIAASSAPFLLIDDQLKAIKQQVEIEWDFQRSTLISEVEDKRDSRVLDELKARKMQAVFIHEIEEVLKRNKMKKPVRPKRIYMEAPVSLADQIQHLRSKVLPTTLKDISILLDDISEQREKFSRIQKLRLAVPDKESLAKIHQALETKTTELHKLEAELHVLEERNRLLNKEADQLEVRYRRVLEEQVDARSEDEDAHRILEHSPKVRATLEAFRIRVIKKNAAKLEALILDSFKTLLRKETLVSTITIDPQTFHLALSDYRGLPLPFAKLSAGERQLLATSLVWGLARASGRTIPTVIDTPLGRLDSSHRHLLVDHYFPSASHQILLLSTDEEIAPRYHSKLMPYISKTYHLQYEANEKRTSIQQCYFPEHETADRNG